MFAPRGCQAAHSPPHPLPGPPASLSPPPRPVPLRCARSGRHARQPQAMEMDDVFEPCSEATDSGVSSAAFSSDSASSSTNLRPRPPPFSVTASRSRRPGGRGARRVVPLELGHGGSGGAPMPDPNVFLHSALHQSDEAWLKVRALALLCLVFVLFVCFVYKQRRKKR